jgi:hypothetical protein
MTEQSGGSGKSGSPLLGFIILAAFMALSAWGGWKARGKMEACVDRPDYGVADLGKDAVVATWDGVEYVAIGAKDLAVAAYHKVAD